MERFKDVVMKLSANAAPDLKNLIQEHLNKFTSGFHTPDHPPYAAMIHSAIIELNEKRGSSEESISEYIKNQHSDLPLAHNSLLKHHLGKLCDSGEIVVTGKHLYILPGSNPTLESRVRTEKDRVTRKRRARKGCGRVGKKGRTETDKHGETHAGEHGETDRCSKGNDEIIGDNNKIKVDNKVNGVGELDQVVKQTDLENRMLDEQSQLHQQLSHAICAPVVDSKQPENSSPDRPPGFEFITFRSKHKDLIVQEPELISNSERLCESDTLPQERLRLRGQPKCSYQIHSEGSKSTSDVSTELLPSQNQQQQMDPLNSDGLQGVKSEDVKLLEPHPKNLKQYGRRKKLYSNTKANTKAKEKAKEMQDVTEKTKQLDLSNLDKSSQPLSPECQQKFEQHDPSVSNDPSEQQGTKKVDQVVRRSQRFVKSTQTHTLSLDLLPSSQSRQLMLENIQSSLQVEVPRLKMEVDYVNLAQKLQQLQLPAVDNFQTTKQTETGSSESSSAHVQKSEQRAKLRSWQKLTARRGSSLALGRTEQVRQEPLCLEYYQQPVHQGRGRGRGRPPKFGQRQNPSINIESPNKGY